MATHSTDIISAARVAFFWVVNATRNEKNLFTVFDTDRGILHALKY